MKKKDIINLINAGKVVEKNKELLSTIKIVGLKDLYYESSFWYPDIPEFEQYFNILKQELISAKNETFQANELMNKAVCSHDIRLQYYSPFGSSNVCVLCNHSVSSGNVSCFKESSYRNKHTVTFYSKIQYGEYNDRYEVTTGKTKEEVVDLVLSILKKYDDEDEIDLVEEFSKLNIEGADINREKRKEENYILIIGGTNLEYLDEDRNLYLTRKTQLTSLSFLKYFSLLLNAKIAVIDREETLENIDFREIAKDCERVCLYKYTSLGHLESALFNVEDIKFKLIIDLSDFYNYEIKENKVVATSYDLNLKKLFSDSYIVKITKLVDKKNLEEIKKFLIDCKKNEQLSMVCCNMGNLEKYYYIDGDEVIYKNLDQTCDVIKRLLRK